MLQFMPIKNLYFLCAHSSLVIVCLQHGGFVGMNKPQDFITGSVKLILVDVCDRIREMAKREEACVLYAERYQHVWLCAESCHFLTSLTTQHVWSQGPELVFRLETAQLCRNVSITTNHPFYGQSIRHFPAITAY